MRRILVLCTALLLVGLLIPFVSAQQEEPSLFDTCPEARDWWEDTAPTLVEFLDVAEIALITPRVSVAPILVGLRSVQRNYQRMNAPDCASLLSFYMNGMMEAVYSGFAEVLGQVPTGFWRGVGDANVALYAASTVIGFEELRQIDTRLVAPEELWGGDSRSEIEAYFSGEFPHEVIIGMATQAAYTATPTFTPSPTNTPTPTETPSPTRTPLIVRTVNPASIDTTPLRTGEYVEIGNAIEVRRFPSPNAPESFELRPGAIVQLVSGPIPIRDQHWWTVQTLDRNSTGWVREDILAGVSRNSVLSATDTPSSPVVLTTAENARISIVAVRNPGAVASELVEIRNNGTAVVDLAGWSLQGAGGNEYVFPPLRQLFGGGSITLFSRMGEDTAIALFWNRQQPAFTRGETIILSDNRGQVQSVFTVP